MQPFLHHWLLLSLCLSMSVIKPLTYYSLHLLLGFKSLGIVSSLQFLIITLQMSSLFLYMFSTC